MSGATQHFTATLIVNRTTHTTATTGQTGYGSGAMHNETKAERDVEEVARIVIREPSMAALAEKLAGHVALIE
jgi:hypothetical protein